MMHREVIGIDCEKSFETRIRLCYKIQVFEGYSRSYIQFPVGGTYGYQWA
jgi:hypothetical protein